MPSPSASTRAATLAKELELGVRKIIAQHEGQRWPAVDYQTRPLDFIREVLRQGLMVHQEEIVQAVRDYDKVAVSSGQKIGKTRLLACLVLWYWCCFPEANITLMMTTRGQMVDVIWREIRKVVLFVKNESGLDLLSDARMAADPSGGLKSADGMRQVIGKNVQQVEALGGISGANMFFVIDEASSMSERTFQAVMGNTAGGAKVLCMSNPTRRDGPFFDIFHKYTLEHDPLYGWWTKIYSARQVAEDCLARGLKIPGVATVDKADEALALYGPDHPAYVIRWLGEFLKQETGKICSYHTIRAAVQRHSTLSDWEGGLAIGVDPSGKTEGADAWGFAAVRGQKCLAIFQRRGISIEAGLEEAARLVEQYRQGDEIPRVLSDIDGVPGIEFEAKARSLSEKLLATDRRKSFTYHGVKPSNWAKRKRNSFERVRDELWNAVAEWLSDGGIPGDALLEAELYAPSWIEVLSKGQSLLKATPKDLLRSPEMLGRSPNLADALSLAVWVPTQFLSDESQDDPPWAPPAPPPQDPARLGTLSGGMSPYDLLSQAMGGGPTRRD